VSAPPRYLSSSQAALRLGISVKALRLYEQRGLISPDRTSAGVFQVHGVDAAGEVILKRKLTRARVVPFFEKLERCLIGIEACATSHYWARELRRLGHDMRLMPPSYVKPYVKRQKNDSADAEAICEAVTRPSMRYVEVKTPEQQSVMVLHRTRAMLMRQRIQLSNAIRAHMAEFGLIAPVGREGLQRLIGIVHDEQDNRVPTEARICLQIHPASRTRSRASFASSGSPT